MRSINNKGSILAIVGISVASALLILSFCGRYLDYGVLRSILNFFVGSFGISFYGMMIAIIALCSMVLMGKSIVVPTRHVINLIFTFIFIVLIVHTFSSVYFFELTFDSYISTVYNYYVVPTFGGVVWGSFCYLLVNSMTIWGASVLLLAALAINLLFVANFCYGVATRQIILDRQVSDTISTERTTFNTPIVERQQDTAENARQEAYSILFNNTGDSTPTSAQPYTQAPTSTVDDMLRTLDHIEQQGHHSGTHDANKSAQTVNIDSFFGGASGADDFDDEDIIVPSVYNQPQPQQPSSTSQIVSSPFAQTTDNIADIEARLNSNDVSVAEMVVEPVQTDSVFTQDTVSYDIQQSSDTTVDTAPTITTDTVVSIETYDNSQYIADNHIADDSASYTGEPVNDVVAQSTQSDDFGGSSQFTVTEVHTPVSGGVQLGFDISDTEELRRQQSAIHRYGRYERPPVELLDDIVISRIDDTQYRQEAFDAIVSKLAVFNIDTEPAEAIVGPTVTQYRLKVLSQKTRMNIFANYADDLQSCLASADSIRIEAPIPGTNLVGIEVANNHRTTVKLRTMLEGDEFGNRKSKLNFAIGQNISGKYIWHDLTTMPHLLVAGTTGSGKSVVLNNLIVSMMYQYSPEYLRFIMVDPKYVELSRYNGCPHLLTSEAITNINDALASMDYLISEMENRFQLFRAQSVSNIVEYNTKINPSIVQKLPYIVLVVDELADLMSSNKKAFEQKILRLAQKARACGIHIVLATQRPSVDIVTGTIKSNLPARIALKVATAVDSKTILGFGGAESLLGSGDMLFVDGRSPGTARIQGAYIDNDEINKVVEYTTAQNEAYFPEEVTKNIFVSRHVEEEVEVVVAEETVKVDILCKKALYLWLCDKGFASISSIQRKLGIGFNRAGKIVESLVGMGYVEDVSASDTSGKRKVLVTLEQLDELFPDQSID